MLVLVLGASGFVGKNLSCFLSNQNGVVVHQYSKIENQIVEGASYDVIVNCVGVNRSSDDNEFVSGNVNFLDWFFTQFVVENNIGFKRVIHISSSKAGEDTIYGKSKLEGESLIKKLCENDNVPVKIIRYANLFGKWSKADYNSVVATWCRDLRLGYESHIDQNDALLNLTYIDHVCDEISSLIFSSEQEFATKCGTNQSEANIEPVSLRDLYAILKKISLSVSDVSLFRPKTSLGKNLYSTYISFLSPVDTIFSLKGHSDIRGAFYEVFKLGGNGQISVSSTMPSKEPRGRHFHMSKVEIFCLLSGSAKMRHKEWGTDKIFENNLTPFDCITTIPGYIHDIENVGSEPLFLLIWANEQFDPSLPDTYQADL